MISGHEKIFRSEGIVVAHGDTLDIMDELVSDSTANLIFADPPYNIGKKFGMFVDRWESDDAYVSWCTQWLDLCIRKLAPDGTLYLMASTQAMPYLDLYLRTRLTVLSRIVWIYDSSGVQAKRHFGSLYEPILHAVKNPKRYVFNGDAVAVEARTGAIRHLIDYRKSTPTLYNSKKVPGNTWAFPRVRYRMDEYEEHPSQKPEALLERIILASSNTGDLIVDPFAGSFTTGAVSKRLKRRFIGIERERSYIKTGLRRIGLLRELDGETLMPPRKTYVRRNGKPLQGIQEMKGNLFDAAT